jgi:hypothetical protein
MEARRRGLRDAFVRGFTVGLREELAAQVTRQLNAARELDFETCPGEVTCFETGRIFEVRRQEPDMPIAQICEGCRLLPTKPGQEPAHLTAALHTASELDALKSAGAVFQYPDALTAYEWTCLTVIQVGRAVSESHSYKEREREAETQSETERLERLRRK